MKTPGRRRFLWVPKNLERVDEHPSEQNQKEPKSNAAPQPHDGQNS